MTTDQVRILKSRIDCSVNFVFPDMREARYVRRKKDYYTIYVSSHNGCNKACHMCHLTQTKQNDFDSTTTESFLEQVKIVREWHLNHHDGKKDFGTAKEVRINFMARGEPLANETILNDAARLFDDIEQVFQDDDINVKFQISTIMPEEVLEKPIGEIFANNRHNLRIFYSLYSVNPTFRKKWLPKAIDPRIAFQQLKELQLQENIPLTLHWAFIDSENDGICNIIDVMNLTKEFSLNYKFNTVHYNPYSALLGKQASKIVIGIRHKQMSEISTEAGSEIIPRAGFDVFSSCGMFVKS